MIDIHSHIIHGLNNGNFNINEATRMIYEAEEAGITKIIITPHYGEFLNNNLKIISYFNELKYKTLNSTVKLILGCEIPINPFLFSRKINIKTSPLKNLKYILMEFPPFSQPGYFYNSILELVNSGYIPILAHPERNIIFQNDIKHLINYKEAGCLIQVDAASITGLYGEKVLRVTRQLLFSDLVDFIASNAYSSCGYNEWFIKAYEKVKHLVGESITNRLFELNAGDILKSYDKEYLFFLTQTNDLSHDI